MDSARSWSRRTSRGNQHILTELMFINRGASPRRDHDDVAERYVSSPCAPTGSRRPRVQADQRASGTRRVHMLFADAPREALRTRRRRRAFRSRPVRRADAGRPAMNRFAMDDAARTVEHRASGGALVVLACCCSARWPATSSRPRSTSTRTPSSPARPTGTRRARRRPRQPRPGFRVVGAARPSQRCRRKSGSACWP